MPGTRTPEKSRATTAGNDHIEPARWIRAEKVDALYAHPAQLPADALGPNMARLNREHSRMLGNGYCVRPKVMDCQYETICESCTFFQTTIEFRPTLLAQRDDACAKGQIRRAQIYDGLITGLDTTEAS